MQINWRALFGNITFVVLIATVFAISFPDIGMLFQPYVALMVMLSIYFSLIKTPMTDVFRSVKSFRSIGYGLILQYLIVGSVGLILAKTFLTNPDLIAGLILVSIMPTGVANIIFADIVKGRLTLMVAIVLSGILLAPFIVPFWALMFIDEYVPVDTAGLFLRTAALIFIPMIAAELTRLRGKRLSAKMSSYSQQIQMTLLFFILFAVVSSSVEYLTDPQNLVVISLITAATILAGIFAGYCTRFFGADWELTKTFMITGARKNTALCFGLVTLFPPMAVLPVVIWTILHNIWIGILQFKLK